MKAGIRRNLLLLLTWIVFYEADAFSPKGFTWPSGRASYYVNQTGGPAGTDTAIQLALNTWSAAGANFQFSYAGETALRELAVDNQNICFFQSFGNLAIIALNNCWFRGDEIVEADIVFNSDFAWSVNGEADTMDVQAIATHELGHSLSLADLYSAADSEKTMYGYSEYGETKKRTLDVDDIAGIIYLYPTPADNFADAITFSANSGTLSGSNSTATAETGEPAHAGRGPYKSIWYKFTPASGGNFTVDTHGSDFNTVLAVYTGSAVDSLTQVAANNNDGSAGQCSGLITALTGGTTYRIAVAGAKPSSAGSTVLNWTFTSTNQPVAFNYTTNSDNTITITGYTGSGGAATIPNTIDGLPVTDFGSVFQYNDTITSITIGTNVTSIAGNAFHCCYSLTNVVIGNSVTSIGNYAFDSCTNLTSIMIPDSVTTIGASTFGYCYNLTSVTIPDSVTSIGGWAFCFCTNLPNVIIGNSVTSIEDNAFYSCTSLTSVTIPTSVTSIGDGAFSSCTSLAGITIPDSVTSLGVSTFYQCTSLTGVYFLGNAPSVGADVFQGSYNATVYRAADATGWPPVPNPWAGRPTALWDSDADGISDPWEERYFGGPTNANPNGICSNGFNTVREAYIAGLNPNDPASVFLMSDLRSITAGDVLQWQSVPGRVYTVYWTTNLMNGFQPLGTNIPWTRSSFTNPTAVPCGYYKINVRLME